MPTMEQILAKYHTDAACGSCQGPLDAERDAICCRCTMETQLQDTRAMLDRIVARVEDSVGVPYTRELACQVTSDGCDQLGIFGGVDYLARLHEHVLEEAERYYGKEKLIEWMAMNDPCRDENQLYRQRAFRVVFEMLRVLDDLPGLNRLVGILHERTSTFGVVARQVDPCNLADAGIEDARNSNDAAARDMLGLTRESE